MDEKMFELSNDYVFSISKILTDVASNDTVLARRFLYTALAAFNPWDSAVECEIEKNIYWIMTNDDNYKDMSDADLSKNKELITIAGIERFFDNNQSQCCFNVSYKSFVEVWSSASAPKDAQASIRRAAKSAVSMAYGRTNELVKNGKKTKITEAMPVFKKIKVVGLTSVQIQLNSSFMPYLVLLTEVFGRGYDKFPIRFLSGKKSISALIMTIFVLRYFVAGDGEKQILRFDVRSLRRILGCENKYPIWKEFRRSIIDRGIKDITWKKDDNKDITESNDDNGFSIKVIDEARNKQGNKTTHVTFEILSKELNAKKRVFSESERKEFKNTSKGVFDTAHSFKPPTSSQQNNSESSPMHQQNMDRVSRMLGRKKS
jgi:hypothetical protein